MAVETSTGVTAIRVDGLVKSYRTVTALDGLDFEIPAGAITGFLGPNGAGKTTTFRSLLGLTRPQEGTIEMLGMTVPADLVPISKKVGAIIEEPGLIRSLTGRVNLEVAADQLGFGHERIGELLGFVGLEGEARRKVEEYSKGMRQRLGLAISLLGDPDLLILDEPLDGLDPAGQHAFRARLRSLADEGKTVVVSSHVLSDIEALADWIVVIDHGRLVSQGPLADLLGSGVTRIALDRTEEALAVLGRAGFKARVEDGVLLVDSEDGSTLVRTLAMAGIYPSLVAPARSTLEKVFLGITDGGSG